MPRAQKVDVPLRVKLELDSQIAELRELIEAAESKTQQLKDAEREANAAIKAMRATKREIQEWFDEYCRHEIDKTVVKHLAEHMQAVVDGFEKIKEKADKEINRLIEALMAGRKSDRKRPGHIDLRDLIERIE